MMNVKKTFKVIFLPVLFLVGMLVMHNQSYDSGIKHVEVDAHPLECLAKNIFFEARGEPIEGQIAVARVVVNRVAHGFSENVCGVVYQTTKMSKKILCQFSWVCQKQIPIKREDPAFLKAKAIAYRVLAFDEYSDTISENVLFFHSTRVKPGWKYRKETQIGNHIFYTK